MTAPMMTGRYCQHGISGHSELLHILRSLPAANTEMRCMKDEADRLLDSARSFKGPPINSSFHYISLFWQAATSRNQCVSPQQGGGTVPASVAKQALDVAHTYCFFCACEARSLAFSLAASAVSLARSVAVSAKVLDGISPTKSQRAEFNTCSKYQCSSNSYEHRHYIVSPCILARTYSKPFMVFVMLLLNLARPNSW